MRIRFIQICVTDVSGVNKTFAQIEYMEIYLGQKNAMLELYDTVLYAAVDPFPVSSSGPFKKFLPVSFLS